MASNDPPGQPSTPEGTEQHQPPHLTPEPPPPPPAVAATAIAVALEASEAAARERATREEDEHKRQKLLERIAIVQAWFSGALVFCAIGQVIFAGLQVVVTKWQHDQMTTQSEVMSGQLCATGEQNYTLIEQTKIAQGQLGAMKDQNAEIVKQVKLADAQLTQAVNANIVGMFAADAAADSADAAKTAAEEAIRSNNIAGKTAERQLRAYLTISETKWETPKSDKMDSKVHLTIIIKNSGSTPANEMNVVLHPFFEQLPYAGDFGFTPDPTAIARKNVIGPDREFQYELDGPTNSQIAEIKADRAAFWLVGMIRYKDIFGEAHCVRFRFVEGNGTEHSPIYGMKYDIEGNSPHQDDCETNPVPKPSPTESK